MTRITLGELKKAARNPAERRAPASSSSRPIPTPYPMASSAVRQYHRHGVEVAMRYLERVIGSSDYWGPGGRAGAQSWAGAVIDAFENYVVMADGDEREFVDTTVRADVGVGDHAVGITLDVVLLDPRGYIGRLPLWDKPLPDEAEAEVLAAPLVAGLQHHLGEDRIPGVEIWHLRSQTELFVESDNAIARMPQVRDIVGRYLSGT